MSLGKRALPELQVRRETGLLGAGLVANRPDQSIARREFFSISFSGNGSISGKAASGLDFKASGAGLDMDAVGSTEGMVWGVEPVRVGSARRGTEP